MRTASVGAAVLATSPTLTQKTESAVPDSAKVFVVHHKGVCPIANEYQMCDPDIVKAMVKETVLRMGMGNDIASVVRGWCSPGKSPATARVKIKFNGTRGLFPAHTGVVNGVVRLLIQEGAIKAKNIHVYENCPKNFGEDDRGIYFGTPFAGGWNQEPGVVYSHLKAPDGENIPDANHREEIRLDPGNGQAKEYTLWFWDSLAKDTDILINIPTLKRHAGTPELTTATLAMKNHFGSIRDPYRQHGPDIGERIAAVNLAKPIRDKQRLIAVDALYAMYTEGPERGRMRYGINKLLVARDPVATDYVGWGMLNAVAQEMRKGEFQPCDEPREIAIAARNGVGVREARWQDHIVAIDLSP